MKFSKLFSILSLTGLLAAPQAFAGEITITDSGDPASWGFGGGPFGIAGEDNETEKGTVRSQAWDMEAFVLSGGSNLQMVGGYDLVNGEAGAGGVLPGWLTPGDLFIKIGGSAPSNLPDNRGVANVNNDYGYDYVIDLTNNALSRNGISASQTSATVFALDSSSILETVVYDDFGANPWRYLSGATTSFSTGISYTSGLNAAQTATATGLNLLGGSHNILNIDLGFLASHPGITDTTNVWLSYTMECGNDSLKGLTQGSPDISVPDNAYSLLLAGLGLGLMVAFSRRRNS